jgi:hypothetical protein
LVIDIAVTLLGSIVSLIGLGLLCVAVVVALAPVIPALWLRLVITAVAYLVVGCAVAAGFARKLGAAVPHLTVPAYEARATLAGIREALSSEQEAHHA